VEVVVRRTLLILSPLLALAAPVHAGPITLNVLKAEYRTYVDMTVVDRTDPERDVATTTSRSITSSNPISDSIVYPGAFIGDQPLGALVDANLFSVSVATAAQPVAEDSPIEVEFATALSDTAIEFRSSKGGLATINIALAFGGQEDFSAAYISLVNLTSNERLWTHGWDYYETSPLWNPYGSLGYNLYDSPLFAGCYDASGFRASCRTTFKMPTYLNRTDEYGLRLFTVTGANGDDERIGVKVSAHTVPEPSSLLLLTLGALGTSLTSRWRLWLRRRSV
jgi:hypothetical protein